MPALNPVAKVVRIRLIGTDAADADLGTGLFFAYSGGAPTVASLTTFATAVGTTWTTNLAPLVDPGYTLTTVSVADLTSQTAPFVNVAVSHPGTRAGAALPLSTCATVRFVTALRRRGGHWHANIRAGTQTDLANPQTWLSAFTVAVYGGYTSFVTGIQGAVWSGGGSLTHVGVQYYGPPNRTVTNSSGRVRTASTPLPVPAQYPVVSYGVATTLGSQRRRLRA